MNRFKFVLKSRGIGNSVERGWQVARRFGLTSARMERRLLRYTDVVARYGGRPSLPITARVLARNPQVTRRLLERGVELCVHSLVHNDLTQLAPDAQAEQIAAACAVFRDHGIPFKGFRSPYLKYNEATLRAVAAAGFAYDSNLPFFWGPLASLDHLAPREREGLEMGLRFYHPVGRPRERSLPRLIGTLVEIPVSLPDDEILLDRMGCPAPRLGEVWGEMLEQALSTGELLTLQLHPERIEILAEVLDGLVARAASSGQVWLATLGEIAAWWEERLAQEVIIEKAGAGRYSVRAGTALRADVSLFDRARGTTAQLRLPATVASSRQPVIGIHPAASADLRIKLKEDGYFIAITSDSEACAVYLGPGTDLRMAKETIARSKECLLVQGTWPAPFRAALAATGDIDCLTLGDFVRRFWEG
ncbi:MAG TPA: polysaccharide deacetylase family protein [bacterium]|nr:polysaccharide deacetylase family protein [bacterium]